MYPDNPKMDFDCTCPIRERKNVWNDITGVHIRFCPMCGERRSQDYEPSAVWEDTGRGLTGEPMPNYLAKQKGDADKRRKLKP